MRFTLTYNKFYAIMLMNKYSLNCIGNPVNVNKSP